MIQIKHGLRHLLAGFGILSMATMGRAGAQTTPLAKQRLITVDGKSYLVTSRLRAILIGTFTYGYDHVQGKNNLDSTLTRIGRAEGWTVDQITDPRQVTSEKLANYQVLFGNYISNWPSPFFPVAGRAAVQDFVEEKGNGLFLMHPGEGGESPDWSWYRTAVMPWHYASEAQRNLASTGKVGVFKGYRNNPSAVGHPILEGVLWDGSDSTLWKNNELHYFDKPILDSLITPSHWQGLYSLNTATCGTPNTCGTGDLHDYSKQGGNWPVSWTFPLKKGNVGYFGEGHDLTTMSSITQPVWDRFFKQFMYYLAGYDTVEVASSILPRGFKPEGADLSYALDPSGITFHPGAAPGVLITKAGDHIVTLYAISGRKIREERGRLAPADYDFGSDLAGRPGVYVLRVTVAGLNRSRKFIAR